MSKVFIISTHLLYVSILCTISVCAMCYFWFKFMNYFILKEQYVLLLNVLLHVSYPLLCYIEY